MKKWQIIVVSIVVIVVLILSFVVGSKGGDDDFESTSLSNDPETIMNNAQKESSAVKSSEVKEPTQIDIYEYLEYKEGSKKTIILLARPTCGYCQIAEPIINTIAYKYELNINYLNTDNFTDDAQALLVKSDEAFQNGYGTPYLFIVQDGKIIDAVDGLTDRAHYIEFFKNNGFIK